MTICPIAIVSGCKKCPAVGMCPLKSAIGDYVDPDIEATQRNERVLRDAQEKDT